MTLRLLAWLLPRRTFLALVAPLARQHRGLGLAAAAVEQLVRYALLFPRDWLVEAGHRLTAPEEVEMPIGQGLLSPRAPRPLGHARAVAAALAVAVHGAALVFGLVWSFIHVQEVTPPPALPLLVVYSPKPPPPPAGGKPPSARGVKVARSDRLQVLAPVDRVAEPVAKLEPEAGPVEPEGEGTCTRDCGRGGTGGGDGDGDGPGVPGGLGDGPPPPPAPPPVERLIPPTMPQPVRVAGERPAYTPEARSARVEGDVILRVCFDTAGAVTRAVVVKGLPMGLTEASVEAARGWRYRPYLLGGHAIPGCVVTRFEFRLTQ